MNLIELLFGFRARINRAKYWIAVIVYIALMLIAGLLLHVMGLSVLFYILIAALYIGVLVSGIAVGIKRLHDRDKTGWWLLVFYVVPGLLSGIGAISGGWHWFFDIPSWAFSIWALVELGFLRGTSGPNHYGPDPLAN